MACSITAKKITLQIINCVYLFVSVISIAAGIMFLLDLKSSSNQKRSHLQHAELASWLYIVLGALVAIFSIFGVYIVAKERIEKITAYWIIHLILLILSVLGVFRLLSMNILTILFSAAAIYLSIDLEREFKTKVSNIIKPV